MKFVFYIILGLLICSCGNSRSYSEQDQQAYQNLTNLVASKQFEIVSHTARPMPTMAFTQVANTNILGPGNTAANINIIGTTNSLRIVADTVSAYLPYYGEQNFAAMPGNNHQGIEFKSMPENYVVSNNDDKHKVEIQFRIQDQYRGNERYNVFITLFPNHTSNIRIQSSTRTPIEFSGSVKPLGKE